jgi:ketosteroid isomerase-like protein
MTILTKPAVNLARAYYQALGNRDTAGVAELLHSDVRLIGPLGDHAGKETVVQAVTNFVPFQEPACARQFRFQRSGNGEL